MIALTNSSATAAIVDPDAELVRAAKEGDVDARNQLVFAQQVRIRRIAARTQRKYSWIDADDVAQHLSIFVMRAIDRYDASIGTIWDKYIWFRMIGAAQDWLRAQDPLGIKWPHRQHYPNFAFGSQLEGSESGSTNSGWVRISYPQDVTESDVSAMVERAIELEPRMLEPDALRLAVLHGMTIAEIVEVCGCWLTVQESLVVGIRRLRKLWKASERATPIVQPPPELKVGGDMRAVVRAVLSNRQQK